MRTSENGCEHTALEDLGWGGSTHYYRCDSCGAPVMNSDGRLWILRPSSVVA